MYAAEDSGDRSLELSACLELGQAITKSPIGEGYITAVEVDVDAAEDAYERALGIAREIGARSEEADALRELAMIEAGRVKLAAMRSSEDGTSKIEILMAGPGAVLHGERPGRSRHCTSTRRSATSRARCRR